MGHRDRHSLVKVPPPDCLIEELDSRPKVASRNSRLMSDSSCSGTEQQSKRLRSSPKVDAKAPLTAAHALQKAVETEKICIEVCAGSGKLTATFKNAGKQCVGIDNLRNKAATGKGFLTLDLTLPASQKIVFDKVAQQRVAFIWFALPCGWGCCWHWLLLGRHGIAVVGLKDGSCGVVDLVLVVCHDTVIMPPSAGTTVSRKNAWRLSSVSCLGLCFRPSVVPLLALY